MSALVDKQCDSCPCMMRRVGRRRRFCGYCLAVRLKARMADAVACGSFKAGRREQEYTLLGAAIDAEIATPTRYWDGLR